MLDLFSIWKRPLEMASKSKDTDFMEEANKIFGKFFLNYSYYVYMIAGFISLCCIFYYIYDCKRNRELLSRRQELQRAHERRSQRRRPGAAYRDHQIFRNALQTVRQYINREEQNKNHKYVLKRTRSGSVYGRYTDE